MKQNNNCDIFTG